MLGGPEQVGISEDVTYETRISPTSPVVGMDTLVCSMRVDFLSDVLRMADVVVLTSLVRASGTSDLSCSRSRRFLDP
jgi:hypothetical protein